MPAKTTTTKASTDYDDDIDLRVIFETLWNARRIIIFTTLAAAVAAFAVSFWFVPRTYEASAYLFIGQPSVEFAKAVTDSGFKISSTLPDLKAVVKLSTAPKLLESVLKDPLVAAAIGDEEISISDMSEMLTAVDVGRDQLSLQVTDTDPERAALLANTWAEKLTTVVNATYGLGVVAQTLDPQVLHSQQDYEQAQTVLEDALSRSQIDALNAQLASKNSELGSVLGGIIRTRYVLDDLQFFEQGLSGLSGESPLSLGDGLALTTLRQRALTVASESFTVQIDSASFTGFTVSMALEAAAQMRAGLQTQLTRLQSDQDRLEQEIPQLHTDLENAQAQLVQFITIRDQAQALYTDLLKTQQQVATVLTQSSKVASVSVEAVPSDKALSRKTLMKTAVAGMLGLMLSALGVLAMNWMKNE